MSFPSWALKMREVEVGEDGRIIGREGGVTGWVAAVESLDIVISSGGCG